MGRVLLVRHATTAETGTRLTGRIPGVPLDERGRVSAERLARRLAPVRLAAIYSSPIDRAWETAAAIAATHRLTPIREDGVIEVDYGDWSGRTLKSLYPLKAWRTVQTTPSRMRFPNGEHLADAQRRALAAVERIAAAHRKQTVAVVTHADVVKSVVGHVLGAPLDLFGRIGVAPASVTVLDFPAQGPPTVRAVNTNGDPETWR